MSEKKMEPTIVCRCMDVSLEEMIGEFQVMVKYLGIADADTFKRISSAMTGYCQGRGCMQHLQRILFSEAKKAGIDVSKLRLVPKKRPPLQPTPIGIYARLDTVGEEE